MTTSPRVPLILGAGQVGSKGRFSDPDEVQRWINLMVKHGQVGLDSGRMYSEGTAEQFIAERDLKGMRIDTKIYPVAPGDHKPEKLKETFKLSLQALGPHKIRVFYLHAPDRTVPFEDTLEAVDELHKAGHFEELGLSNYMSFEVAEIVGICRRRGFVLPTVYEGVYNLLDRSSEAELFPCLRKFGIRFAAYSVLAGGFLTGKHLTPSAQVEPGSHFDKNWAWSWYYHDRYDYMIESLRDLQTVCDKHGLRLAEVSYRWLQHHSAFQPGDHGVIIGASRAEQLETAILDSLKGPLPQDVLDKIEETWQKVRGNAKNYWL